MSAFEKQIHALYQTGERIRHEHSAWLNPPCKDHFVTVVGGDDDSSYAVIEWLVEYIGMPADQIVFVTHLSAYPSLSEQWFQDHFIGENAGDEAGRLERLRKYDIIRLGTLNGYLTNFYTDDLQYQPVRSTRLAIIIFPNGINSFDQVTSPEPIPNLDSADPVSQSQYREWETQMKMRFLSANGRDAAARTDLMRVQGELASLGVATTMVVEPEPEKWLTQQAWLKAFFECYASLWKPAAKR